MYHKSKKKGAQQQFTPSDTNIIDGGPNIDVPAFAKGNGRWPLPPASVGRGNRNRSSEAENDQLSPIVCWSLSISKSFRLIPYANKLRVIICLTGWSSICCNLEVTKGQMNTSYWTPGPLAGVREQFWKSLIESKHMTSSRQKPGFSGTFNFKEW